MNPDIENNNDYEELKGNDIFTQIDLDVPDKIPEDPFIYIDNNNLDKELCENIIASFDKDLRKERGLFGDSRIDQRVKDTTDLVISGFPEQCWREYDKKLYKALNKAIVNYLSIVNKYNIIIPNFIFDKSGYQIQKYEKNKGKYVWHIDSLIHSSCHRYAAFIWYLNDVPEGGETCFLNGKVKPTAGKLIIFPATWTYVHRGNVPKSNDKYIVTGWIYVPNQKS